VLCVAVVGRAVAVVAVGRALQEKRLVGSAHLGDDLADARVDAEHVLPVDALALHGYERRVGQIRVGVRALDRRAHRVAVVFEHEQHGAPCTAGTCSASRGTPPWFIEPSPKKQTQTWSPPRYLIAQPSPSAMGTLPPTMP
jgi:hypothetical protein